MKHNSLIVEYKNSRPIELLELTASLSAVGNEFKRYAADEGGVDADARLFVHQIRAGSTIAELVAMGQAVGDLYDAAEQLGSFAPVFYDLLNTILQMPPKAREIEKASLRNAASFVAPVTLDTAGTVNLIDNRNGTINNYTVTPVEAAAITHNANHLLNSQMPSENRFTNEPMTVFQMRNAPPGKAGDFGIIDCFAATAKKLTFASDQTKDAILHHDANIFEQVFWVDGVVKTSGGNVVGYSISNLRDISPKTD